MKYVVLQITDRNKSLPNYMAKKKTKKKSQVKSKKQTKPTTKQAEQPKPQPMSFEQQVASLGRQIKTYRVQDVWPGTGGPSGRIQFFGMGGSAIAADLVNNYLRHFGLPDFLHIRKDFYRPQDGNHPTPAIFSSYSGTTAETITQAYNYRGRVASVITTGGDLLKLAESRKWGVIKLPLGFQPRAALGYSFSSLLSLVIAHQQIRQLASRISADLNAAGRHISNIKDENKFAIRAVNIAEKIKGKSVAVYSSEAISGINYRWRGQLQENADNFAFGGFFPEITHNHVNGFANPEGLSDRLAIIILKWKADPMGLSEKQNKLASLLRSRGFTVIEIGTKTKTLLSAMFELIYLADEVSMKLAEMNGTNAESIEIIQSLKI